ncbi:unnamed protein product [Gongylonema pulchrum]|uniref:CRAL-TRIO domain-containing protein n=1 Tax=Gongylonema pulchrum TaxID=637853 RepID=A0A183D422_9BILA|nr:unnamed protein product [Gongylonema pulchrum]
MIKTAGARKDVTAFVVDLPPRYSEVVPPSYEWVLKHHYSDIKLKVLLTKKWINSIFPISILKPFIYVLNKEFPKYQ